MLNKIFKIILVLDLVGVNVAVGYAIYKSQGPNPKIQTISNDQIPNVQTRIEYVDKCGDECMTVIKNQITSLQIKDQKIVVVTPPLRLKASEGQASKKTRSEEILTIPGSGSTTANGWTDIPGTEFYFDGRDWPGIVEVYFEANMRLVNGNGLAYVRLFDVTHGIGVTGSENNTSSQSDVWTKSQKSSFWAGKNLIRVQAKSLTADTAVYTQGRLRIVVEN